MRNEVWNKIILDLNNTPYERLFSQMTSKDVKKFIYNEFINLGCTKEQIDKNIMDVIPVEYVNMYRINEDANMKGMFNYFSSIIEEAYRINESEVVEIMYEYNNYLKNASDKFMINFSLESDKDNEDLYEFCTISFEELGKLLEATIKPYLSIYLAMIKVIEGENISFTQIRCKTLGSIIYDIEKNSKYKNNIIYKDSVYNIKLSDIRNICKHDEYEVIDNKVLCKYGKDLSKEIYLNKYEIIRIFKECQKKLVCIRVPLTIFIISKVDSYVQDSGVNCKPIETVEENNEIRDIDEILYSLVYLLSQGYMIKNIQQNEGVKLVLKDLANEDVKWRTSYLMAHLFRCYFNLSKIYKYIDITYLDYYGMKYMNLILDCEKYNEVKDIEDLIKKTQIKKYVND